MARNERSFFRSGGLGRIQNRRLPCDTDRSCGLRRRVGGISLVEWLIASTLGVFIVGLAVVFYLMATKNFHEQGAHQLLSDRARHAIDLIEKEVQLAGYMGLTTWQEEAPAILFSAHEILVQHAALAHATLVEDMKDNWQLVTDQAMKLKVGESLVISDSVHYDLCIPVSMTRAHHQQTIRCGRPLRYLFRRFSEASLFEVNRLFVKNNCLMLENSAHRHTRLVDGIVSMKIQLAGDLLKPVLAQIALRVSASQLEKTWYADMALSS